MDLGLTFLHVLITGERAIKLNGEGGMLFPLQGAHCKWGNTGEIDSLFRQLMSNHSCKLNTGKKKKKSPS